MGWSNRDRAIERLEEPDPALTRSRATNRAEARHLRQAFSRLHEPLARCRNALLFDNTPLHRSAEPRGLYYQILSLSVAVLARPSCCFFFCTQILQEPGGLSSRLATPRGAASGARLGLVLAIESISEGFII